MLKRTYTLYLCIHIIIDMTIDYFLIVRQTPDSRIRVKCKNNIIGYIFIVVGLALGLVQFYLF